MHDTSLAPYTSLNVGGPAERLHRIETTEELVRTLTEFDDLTTVLGYGCNVLISDRGLRGDSLLLRNDTITVAGNEVVAEAGAWWDNVVQTALGHQLWGLELMSGIPSSVGGAIYGNIAAYGQQISDTLAWVEVYNRTTQQVERRPASDFSFAYRASSLQQHPELIIIRAGFTLSNVPRHELQYDSALAIAEELELDPHQLDQCRKAIIETRCRAGSMYDPHDPATEHSAGSFFKNPLVSTELARELARFDETGKTLERIERQSRVHGGDTHRASAAHVLLAAGFHRGQSWGPVTLHKRHVLKIVTHTGATADQVFSVVQEIIRTVEESFSITLEPEVKLLGTFTPDTP